MIPIWPCAPFNGFVVKRVWITSYRTIEPYADDTASSGLILVVYRVASDGEDELGRLDTAKEGIAAFTPVVITGQADLDLELRAGEGLALNATRLGLKAPSLRGFAAQVDWQYVGS